MSLGTPSLNLIIMSEGIFNALYNDVLLYNKYFNQSIK